MYGKRYTHQGTGRRYTREVYQVIYTREAYQGGITGYIHTREAYRAIPTLGTPCAIHHPMYTLWYTSHVHPGYTPVTLGIP